MAIPNLRSGERHRPLTARFLQLSDVAEILNISAAQTYALVRSGELPAIKIASPDIVNTPLLARCAGLGRPLLISTGAATLEEIDAAVESVHSANIPFALLHCISSYPAPDESANLCWIGELMARYGVAIGYSDHTTNALAGAAAAAAGACIIEKHLTYDRDATGPDHSASADAARARRQARAVD